MAKYAKVPFAFGRDGQIVVISASTEYEDDDPIVLEWPDFFTDVVPDYR